VGSAVACKACWAIAGSGCDCAPATAGDARVVSRGDELGGAGEFHMKVGNGCEHEPAGNAGPDAGDACAGEPSGSGSGTCDCGEGGGGDVDLRPVGGGEGGAR